MRRRKRLGELGIALLHVIEVGYNTRYRRRAENTKWFGLASLGRYSNLRNNFNEKRFGKLTHIARPVRKTLLFVTLSQNLLLYLSKRRELRSSRKIASESWKTEDFLRRNFNKETDFISVFCELTYLNLCTTVCNFTLIYNFLRTVSYIFWLKYQFINCVDNMSTHNAEPFENLPDSVSIPAEDPSNWVGEPSTGIDSTEGRVREARLWRRDLQKRIQACTDRLLAFKTEEKILLFGKMRLKIYIERFGTF